MARDDDIDDAQDGEEHEPRECMACRGTGQVISNLGGTPSTVECPWCKGGRMRLVGSDAQEGWPATPEPAPPAGEQPPDPAA